MFWFTLALFFFPRESGMKVEWKERKWNEMEVKRNGNGNGNGNFFYFIIIINSLKVLQHYVHIHTTGKKVIHVITPHLGKKLHHHTTREWRKALPVPFHPKDWLFGCSLSREWQEGIGTECVGIEGWGRSFLLFFYVCKNWLTHLFQLGCPHQ
jgi:hypothetical protein